jgi:hypothetical protein
METRRALNPAMPTALVVAQLALYLGAFYAVARGLAQLRFPGWELLIGGWMVLAAYGIANEARWGWRMGLVAGAVSIVPALDQLVRAPAIALHPDFLVLLVVPLLIVGCLWEPSARDFRRAWFR